MKSNLLCVAEIAGVHGIKGAVKLRSFVDNLDLLTGHGPLLDKNGQESLSVRSLHQHGAILLAEFEGVTDRTAAEKLRGKKFFLPRDLLPQIKKEGTWYHIDLVGLDAVHVNGEKLGSVINVANFGAGDLLEIQPEKGASFYVPFTDAAVPDVDVAARRVLIDPPEGLIS